MGLSPDAIWAKANNSQPNVFIISYSYFVSTVAFCMKIWIGLDIIFILNCLWDLNLNLYMLQLPISIRGIDRKSERRSCNVCIELEHNQRQNIFAWMVMVFPTIHFNTNISVLLVDLYHVSIIQKILDKVNCLNMSINAEIIKHFIDIYH